MAPFLNLVDIIANDIDIVWNKSVPMYIIVAFAKGSVLLTLARLADGPTNQSRTFSSWTSNSLRLAMDFFNVIASLDLLPLSIYAFAPPFTQHYSQDRIFIPDGPLNLKLLPSSPERLNCQLRSELNTFFLQNKNRLTAAKTILKRNQIQTLLRCSKTATNWGLKFRNNCDYQFYFI